MNLEEIIDASEFEDIRQECTVRLNRNDVGGWLKTIAGFSNADGGNFFVGVEDKTNKLIGFDRMEADNERNYLNNQINEHLYPRPSYSIHFLKYEIHGKERYILQAVVDASEIKPVVLKFDGVPAIYMRRNGFTNAATYEEIRRMALESSDLQYEQIVSKEKYAPKDFQKLFAFCKTHEGKNLSDKFLREIGFVNQDGMLRNGAVLFRDDYEGGKTAVQCSLFSGFTKGSQRIVSVNHFTGNITDSIQYMNDYVKARMNHGIIKLNDRHVDVDAYPDRALFEGIVNAVAHRDYFLDGTQIQIDMFRDRLEISSPGSFYEGAPLGRTSDLSSIISKRRNELICAVLVRCNVMEAAGTGFDKIIEDYEQADENHKPYVYSSSDHFTLVLPDLTYEPGLSTDISETVAFVPVPDGTKHDAKILAYCYPLARKSADIAAYLGIADSTYFRQKVLEHLAETGYLEKSKAGRTVYYKTNRNLVRKE